MDILQTRVVVLLQIWIVLKKFLLQVIIKGKSHINSSDT